MNVEWDYTELAASYVNRPEYSEEGLNQIFTISGLQAGDRICDIGAGVAHLTIPLLKRGFVVDAVEPNDAMRELGIQRTRLFQKVTWHEGTGEATGMQSGQYAMATFGSSFNVMDQAKALQEVVRICMPGGWFVCMWNHRDLEDPLQKEIESLIRTHNSEYDYGKRRADQTEILNRSGLFGKLRTIEAPVQHKVSARDWVDAWRSHATLQRQLPDKKKFDEVVGAIDTVVRARGESELTIPYTTRIWIGQLKKA